MDKNALAAALAGEQAHDQGKFWEFHDAILKLNGDVDMDDIERIAAMFGLNTKALDNIEPEARGLLNIKRDISAAKRIGVYFSGTFSYEQLEKQIQAELKRQKKHTRGLNTDSSSTIENKQHSNTVN